MPGRQVYKTAVEFNEALGNATALGSPTLGFQENGNEGDAAGDRSVSIAAPQATIVGPKAAIEAGNILLLTEGSLPEHWGDGERTVYKICSSADSATILVYHAGMGFAAARANLVERAACIDVKNLKAGVRVLTDSVTVHAKHRPELVIFPLSIAQ
jgi:hypothetical protein